MDYREINRAELLGASKPVESGDPRLSATISVVRGFSSDAHIATQLVPWRSVAILANGGRFLTAGVTNRSRIKKALCGRIGHLSPRTDLGSAVGSW
jgi:hypothetical protein